MDDELISVVLPCRDVGNTVVETLESLEGQTDRHFEVVAVNDGSIDETGALLDRRAATDARFRVLHTEPRGIVSALKRGIDASRGALLCRMDGDDTAHPQRLERQRAYMNDHPDCALCGTLVAQFGDEIGEGRLRYETWINGVVTPEDITRNMFVECPLSHPTWLMRRGAYERAGGYRDGAWPEDYELLLRMYALGMEMGKVDDALVRWRHSAGRLSMNDERYSAENFRRLKHRYLMQTHLANDRPFFQWGAGQVGKPWLREWDARKPEAVVDLHPRKIGKTIHDVRVIPPEELPAPGEHLVVAAVGAPGARDEIRAWLSERAYREGSDFLFLA
jgi:glycosyltransferase involved in cell wall biosynthesis